MEDINRKYGTVLVTYCVIKHKILIKFSKYGVDFPVEKSATYLGRWLLPTGNCLLEKISITRGN